MTPARRRIFAARSVTGLFAVPAYPLPTPPGVRDEIEVMLGDGVIEAAGGRVFLFARKEIPLDLYRVTAAGDAECTADGIPYWVDPGG